MTAETEQAHLEAVADYEAARAERADRYSEYAEKAADMAEAVAG